MRLFLDTSALLAAAGSATGASRSIFTLAAGTGWQLVTSGYALAEVRRNLPKLPPHASTAWSQMARGLRQVPDALTLDKPVIFLVSKDRPILFSALAWADVLLTLDEQDFGSLLGGSVYGLDVLTPSGFLRRERAAGRLVER